MQNLKNIREQPFIHEKGMHFVISVLAIYHDKVFTVRGQNIASVQQKVLVTQNNEYENLFKQSSIPKLDHAIPPSSGHLAGLMGVPQHLHIEVSLELSGWVVYGVDWVGISIFCAQ